MNFFSSFSSKRKFTVPADKKGESAKHFGDGVRTEFVVLLGSNLGAENCLFSGERPLGNHADFLYHMADADRCVRIVIRYEDADALKLRNDLIARRSCITSGRWTSFSSILTRPLSIRLISSTSLMRLKRCWPEVEILFRYSCTWSG